MIAILAALVTQVMGFDTAGAGADYYAEARVALSGADSAWSLSVCAPSDTVTVTFSRTAEAKFFDDDLTRALVTVTRSGKEIARHQPAEEFAAGDGEYNSLVITVQDSVIAVAGGHRYMRRVLTIPSCGLTPTAAELEVRGTGDVADFITETDVRLEKTLMTAYSAEALRERFDATDDPVEGFWDYLDRENNPRYARPGGRYRIALVNDGGGNYDIIYVAGAEVESSRWHPGMRKGLLTATPFVGHYDMQWIDSTFHKRLTDMHADIDAEGILTLSFPLLETKLRFYKAK